MSALPALHVQPLNGPRVFLPRSWLIPCGTLLLRCIYLRYSLFMWVKDSPTHWRTAFGFKDHLSVCDIALDVPLNTSYLQICIKASKTDPFRKGCNILIRSGSPPLCAVQAVVSFLEHWGNRPGPLFLFENGLSLSRSLLTDRLRVILVSAGLPGDFSSHSFRIGAATSAARAGIPDQLIQVLGPLEKRCLQTMYSNSSWPQNSRC